MYCAHHPGFSRGRRGALLSWKNTATARKEMLPSEKAALGMAIEEFEKPAAQERMLAGKAPSVPGNLGSAHQSLSLGLPATWHLRRTFRGESDEASTG